MICTNVDKCEWKRTRAHTHTQTKAYMQSVSFVIHKCQYKRNVLHFCKTSLIHRQTLTYIHPHGTTTSSNTFVALSHTQYICVSFESEVNGCDLRILSGTVVSFLISCNCYLYLSLSLFPISLGMRCCFCLLYVSRLFLVLHNFEWFLHFLWKRKYFILHKIFSKCKNKTKYEKIRFRFLTAVMTPNCLFIWVCSTEEIVS